MALSTTGLGWVLQAVAFILRRGNDIQLLCGTEQADIILVEDNSARLVIYNLQRTPGHQSNTANNYITSVYMYIIINQPVNVKNIIFI